MLFFIGIAVFFLFILTYVFKFSKKSRSHTNVTSNKAESKNNTKLVSVPVIDLQNPILASEEINTIQAQSIPETPEKLQRFHLIKPDEIDQAITKRILEITKNIPRPHPILRSITQDFTNSEELYELIISDPEIAAKVLQTVNSAAFSMNQKVTSLQYAILYLGMNLVKNIVLQVALTGMTPDDPIQSRGFHNIWSTGFLASSMSTILAKNLELENASELATQTLLSYIGDIAIVSFRPQFSMQYINSVSLLERIVAQQQELGTNSALIGARLALEWELPSVLELHIKQSLIPLTNPINYHGVVPDFLHGVVFCYLVSRVCELIVLNRIKDVGDIDFSSIDTPEFFYLPQYLKLVGLEKLSTIMQAKDVKAKINQLINRTNQVT